MQSWLICTTVTEFFCRILQISFKLPIFSAASEIFVQIAFLAQVTFKSFSLNHWESKFMKSELKT